MATATSTYRVFDPLLPRAQAERMLRLCERFGALGRVGRRVPA
jgi:hypothetical protein